MTWAVHARLRQEQGGKYDVMAAGEALRFFRACTASWLLQVSRCWCLLSWRGAVCPVAASLPRLRFHCTAYPAAAGVTLLVTAILALGGRENAMLISGGCLCALWLPFAAARVWACCPRPLMPCTCACAALRRSCTACFAAQLPLRMRPAPTSILTFPLCRHHCAQAAAPAHDRYHWLHSGQRRTDDPLPRAHLWCVRLLVVILC